MSVVGDPVEVAAAAGTDHPVDADHRTVRPIVIWSMAILVSLGLAWFIGAVGIPFYQAKKALGPMRFPYEARQATWASSPALGVVAELGGDRPALRKITVYLRMPPFLARDKEKALDVAAHCLPHDREWYAVVTPALMVCSRDPNRNVRAWAADWLGGCRGFKRDVIPVLEAAARDADEGVRSTAAGALKRIRSDEEGE